MGCATLDQTLLALCDELRDQKLPELGVLLEDKDGRTVVKYVGKELALQEREKLAQAQEEKQRMKEEQKRKQQEMQVRTVAGNSLVPVMSSLAEQV